jgi:hypothetical protein
MQTHIPSSAIPPRKCGKCVLYFDLSSKKWQWLLKCGHKPLPAALLSVCWLLRLIDGGSFSLLILES